MTYLDPLLENHVCTSRDLLYGSIVPKSWELNGYFFGQFKGYVISVVKYLFNVVLSESEQITGSAKARGAFGKLLTLKDENPEMMEKGAVVASTGNHGIACVSVFFLLPW